VIEIRIGSEAAAHVAITVVGYARPQVGAPNGIDVLDCVVRVSAGPLSGDITCPIRLAELATVRAYLARINSGNGPQASFAMAGGLFTLSFAPSRRGPVLCAAMLKSIEASHARLEFMIALEPSDISFALGGLASLPPED
jgi:hypothetical protein